MILAGLIIACVALVGVLALALFAVVLHQRQGEVERLYATLAHLPMQWENVHQQLRALAGRVDKRAGILAKSGEKDTDRAAGADPETIPTPAPAVPVFQVKSRHDLLAQLHTTGGNNGK